MVKGFVRAYVSNLNDSKYINNKEIIDAIDDKEKEEMDYYSEDLRYKNMHIYKKNMFKLRLEQLLKAYVPISLAICTGVSFIVPYKKVVKAEALTYLETDTILSDKEGETFGDAHLYADINNEIVGDTYEKYDGDTSKLTYQVYDGLDSLLAEFSYNEDGKLNLENVDVGKYIKTDDYEYGSSIDIEKKYENLFDNVLDVIINEGDLTLQEKEIVNNIITSEDKETIIKISKVSAAGKKNIDVYENRFWMRFLLLMTISIYMYVWFAYYMDYDNPVFKNVELDTDGNGRLYEKMGEYTRRKVFKAGFKYKKAFIKAEKERIKKSYQIIGKYINNNQTKDLYNGYERTLIKKLYNK